jgi:hypothetical protein
MRVIAAAAAVFIVSPAFAQEAPIHLMCGGEAQVIKRQTATAYGSNNAGQWSTATVGFDSPADSEENVRIDLNGIAGEIRLPMFMLPPIHGGKNGVLPLRDITYSQNEIVAKATLNFINQPKIVLDRLTGMVSISGFRVAFSGKCVAYDPAVTRRAF